MFSSFNKAVCVLRVLQVVMSNPCIEGKARTILMREFRKLRQIVDCVI